MVEGIYEVRGLDLSGMTLVEGERGVIVIDPLISTETGPHHSWTRPDVRGLVAEITRHG